MKKISKEIVCWDILNMEYYHNNQCVKFFTIKGEPITFQDKLLVMNINDTIIVDKDESSGYYSAIRNIKKYGNWVFKKIKSKVLIVRIK